MHEVAVTERGTFFGYAEHEYKVTIPTTTLGGGQYWIMVQPIGNGTGRSFQSTTSGANEVE